MREAQVNVALAWNPSSMRPSDPGVQCGADIAKFKRVLCAPSELYICLNNHCVQRGQECQASGTKRAKVKSSLKSFDPKFFDVAPEHHKRETQTLISATISQHPDKGKLPRLSHFGAGTGCTSPF